MYTCAARGLCCLADGGITDIAAFGAVPHLGKSKSNAFINDALIIITYYSLLPF